MHFLGGVFACLPCQGKGGDFFSRRIQEKKYDLYLDNEQRNIIEIGTKGKRALSPLIAILLR